MHPSGSRARRIWDLIVPVDSSERLSFFVFSIDVIDRILRDIDNISLCLPHDVNVPHMVLETHTSSHLTRTIELVVPHYEGK